MIFFNFLFKNGYITLYITETYTEGLMELYNTRGKNIQFDSR